MELSFALRCCSNSISLSQLVFVFKSSLLSLHLKFQVTVSLVAKYIRTWTTVSLSSNNPRGPARCG